MVAGAGWLLPVLVALCAGQLQGGSGGGIGVVPGRELKDITFYLTDFIGGIGPCAGGLPVDPTIVPMCIAAMAERCAREQAADTEWIFTRGGFAGFVYSNLTRFQIGSIFAATTFGPCNIIFQQGQNVTVHSAWTRTYTCRGTTYSGVEAVETVLDPRTQLVTWNWIANEPLWAGLGDCIASLI